MALHMQHVVKYSTLRLWCLGFAGAKGAEGEGTAVEKSERASGLGGFLRRRKVKGEEGAGAKKEGGARRGREGTKKEEDAEPFALKGVNLVVRR